MFSAFLSILIIYMGVGIPFVQYSCATCISTDKVSPLIVVEEFSGNPCGCGCSDNATSKNDDCAKKKGCCCCRNKVSKGITKSDSKTDNAENSCSKVRIEKINLPTLASRIHLDTVVMPVIDFMSCNLSNSGINYSFERLREYYETTPPHNISPRTYINYICTLLI